MELLEIEKELAGPDREAAMMRYDRVLVGLAERLRTALREGLPPDEYDRAERLADAVVTARKLLRLQVRQTERTDRSPFAAVK